MGLKDGTLYANETFNLYDAHGGTVQHRGLWCVTDNGFHMWRPTQFPSKIAREEWLARWSKRLESMRKPGTECIYGIVKKRWRILALPLSFMDTYKVDNLFRFLLSLHNRLQRHYGLDRVGCQSTDWKAANTDLDEKLIAEQGGFGGVPFLVNDAAVGNETTPEFEASWSSLRGALVTHFRVAFEKKEILWRKTAAECRPNYRTEPRVRRVPDGDDDVEDGNP